MGIIDDNTGMFYSDGKCSGMYFKGKFINREDVSKGMWENMIDQKHSFFGWLFDY